MFNYIKVYLISTRTFACFRRKMASINSFIDKDWLGKVVMTLLKKLLDDINGSGTFPAKDGPIISENIC